MFTRYSVNHAHDVYRMLNIDTKKIINSQDIVWLNKVYNDWKDKKENDHLDDFDDDAIEPRIQDVRNDQEKVQEEKESDELKKNKVHRNMRQLESSFNPEAAKIVEKFEQEREILLNHAIFAFFGGGIGNQ